MATEKEEHKNGRSAASCALHIAGVVFGSVIFEVFFVLCLRFFSESWSAPLWFTLLVLGSVLNAAVLAADLVFYYLDKQVIYKFCITVYIVAVFFAILLYILLVTGFFEIMSDEERFEEFLARSGWMYVLFVLLQFLQVVILPIPSTVTVVAGAALFNPLWGSLLSLLGIVLGSLVAFLIGRFAGQRVVAWLIGKDTLEKWMKKIKGKDKLLLSAMFLLPVFPDDVLCFVAGLSSMSLWLFLAVILVSRVLAIFTTSYSITLIPFNTWWGILTWVVLGIAVVILFVVLYRKSDAILGWFARKFHRETRVEEKPAKDEFTLEVVDPDGSVVTKGVKRKGTDEPPPKDG